MTDPAAQVETAELERERLVSLINSMGDGVIATDENTNVVLYNGAALNILDINTPMVNKPISENLKLIDKNNQPIDLKNVIINSKVSTSSRDWRLEYPDKTTINLYISIAPVHLGYGKDGSRGFIVLMRDITREKSLEEERDEFISVVSHELRTPIAIAEGNISNAQLIAERGGDPTVIKNALEQAHNQINFLSGLINDLATLSRAERGRLTVEVEPINIHDLVLELVNNYTPQAEAKQLYIQTQLDPQLQLLKSSKLYVREILQNFITNAIKYTEKGGLVIAAKQEPTGVWLAVTDTGIGISHTDQDKVFDKFFRSEDFRTRKNNGTGLGLYVTLKLARLLHSEIKIQSELNKGSTFSISIPNLQ